MAYRKVVSRKRRIGRDWTGERIGKLLVLGMSTIRSNGETGQTLWICRCDCGKEIEITSQRFNKTDPQSRKTHCGCSGKNGTKYLKIEKYDNSHKVISTYIMGSKRRKIEWGLSVNEALGLFVSECYYCGKQPSNIKSEIKTEPPYLYNGIDRLDPKKGYSIDNCVSCCTKCNYAKSDMHVDEFLEFIKEVYENRIKK